MPTFTDLHPVARHGDHSWLLLPLGEELDPEDERPIYYQYRADFDHLSDPLPLQVWLKHIPYEKVTKRDVAAFSALVAKRARPTTYAAFLDQLHRAKLEALEKLYAGSEGAEDAAKTAALADDPAEAVKIFKAVMAYRAGAVSKADVARLEARFRVRALRAAAAYSEEKTEIKPEENKRRTD